MAFSAVTIRGQAVSTGTDATLPVNPSAALTVGKLLVVSFFTKNVATTDGATTSHSLADSKNHVWTKLGEFTETAAGAANDGSTVSVWMTIVTTQLETTDTITGTISTAIANKIISVFEATKGATTVVALAQMGVGQNTLTAAVSALPSREYLLVYAAAAVGTDTAKTAGTNYTEQFDTRSQNAAGAITNFVGTRIATLTSDSTAATAWTNTVPISTLSALYEVLAVNQTENIKVSDTATPSMALGPVSLTESVLVDDVGTGSAFQYTAPILVSDVLFQPVLEAGVETLTTGLLTENLKISDAATPALTPLLVNRTESVLVSDTATPALTPELVSRTESVLVSDVVTPALTPELVSRTESVLVSDAVTPALTPELVTRTENILVSDAATALLNPLQTAPLETVLVTDALTPPVLEGGAPDLVAPLLTENIRIDDASESFAQMEIVEILLVTDAVSASISPLLVALQDDIKVSDAAQANAGLTTGLLTETVLVSDTRTVALTPELVTLTESVLVTDTAAVVLNPLRVSLQENLLLTDTATPGLALLASKSETLLVTEQLTARLNPLQTSRSESVLVSDAVTLRINPLRLTLQENVLVSDAAQGSSGLIAPVSSESVLVTDTVTALLSLATLQTDTLLVTDAAQADRIDQGELTRTVPPESVLVRDTVTAQITPLLVTLTESVLLSETGNRILGAGALLEEPVLVRDVLTLFINPLETALTESVLVEDDYRGISGRIRATQVSVVTASAINVSVVAASATAVSVTTATIRNVEDS